MFEHEKYILQLSLHYLIANSLQYIMDRMNRSCGYVSNKIEYINTYATHLHFNYTRAVIFTKITHLIHELFHGEFPLVSHKIYNISEFKHYQIYAVYLLFFNYR